MELLIKAHKTEDSPYKAVNQYIDQTEKYCKEITSILIESVCSILDIKLKKSSEDAPLIFKGRIQYSPKTGKPITMSEWKRLEDSIIKYLNIEKKELERKMSSDSYWLGTLLARMDKQQRLTTDLKKIDLSNPDFKKFNKMYKDQMEVNRQLTGVYIQNTTDKAKSKIQQILLRGIIDKKSNSKVFQDLWDFEEDINRDWERVVRTEIPTHANNGAMIEILNTSEEEHIFMKGISAPTACEHCQRLVKDKMVVLLKEPINDEFITIKGKTYPVIWPGKSNYGRKAVNYQVASTIHPYCLLPDQEVTAPLIDSVTEGFYKGRIVEITTSSGRIITVTENHPILTPKGFLSAKFFNEGDYVISSPDPQRIMKTINPDYYQGSTTIENLFTSAKHSSLMPPITMPVSTKDFHGDGRSLNSNVNIVDAYGLLGNDINTSLNELINKNFFRGIDLRIILNLQSSFNKDIFRNFFSSNSPVSSFSNFLTFFNRSIRHSNKHSFTSIPWSNSGFDKSLSKGISRHSQFSREFLFRFSRQISFNNSFAKIRVNRFSSPLLIPDKIIHIRNLSYNGKVYDLSDAIYGLYISNGVVVKNCRCTWVEWFEELEDLI